MGRIVGVFEQAVRMGKGGEWGRQLMDREELVLLEGSRAVNKRETEVLVEGEELWQEWRGQQVASTRWLKEEREVWGTEGRPSDRLVERDKVYDKG